jgi:hypothetical protein
MPKTAFTYLKNGRSDLFKAVFKAVWWHFTHYKGLHGLPKLKKN